MERTLACSTKETHGSVAQSILLFTVFWRKKNFICRIFGREAKALVFADSSTYSGRDDNPLFDEDDELALMARHLGPRASHTITTFPKNVQQVHMCCTYIMVR